jgi:heptosyltransferase II
MGPLESKSSLNSPADVVAASPRRHVPDNLMVRVPNWVGDAVMAVPALRELRRIFSGARITLVARPWVSGLFDGEHLADECVAISDARGFFGRASQFVAEAHRLRRKRFDAAVLLQNAFGAALFARAAGARFVAGYATDGRRALLNHVVPFEPDYKSLHQVRYYLNIAAEMERMLTGESHVEMDGAKPTLRADAEAKARAEALLAASGITTRAPIVAINPGATNSRAKQWLPDRFAETADRLSERDGFQTVIVGAAGDTVAASEVARRMKSNAAMLAGKTDIGELKAVLASAALVLSNDTGAAHVSAALGVPTVVVFGPTEHVSTRPLSDLATVVRHNVECSPCMLRDCPIDHRCMTRVEVDDVYRAARNLLASAALDFTER